MNKFFIKKIIICYAIGFFTASAIFITGCAPKRVTVAYEKDGNSGYSEAGHKDQNERKGPPPHAPARGYRAKHQYRYYPACSVYFDTGRRIYFYLEGDNWEVGASLPSSLQMRLGDYVNMELDTDRPYIYHEDHVKKYPPGQMKKKNKKKGKWG